MPHSIWWTTISAVALYSDAGGGTAADVIRDVWLGGADRWCLPHSLLLVPADVSADVGAGSAILATCSRIQVSVTHHRCLDLSLAGAATSIIFVMTSTCLSWQHTFFVATKVCLPRQSFCFDKIIFVATKYFCRKKSFSATNTCLSQQAYFGCDKRPVLSRQTSVTFVATNICHSKTFVAANTCCRDKNDTCGSSRQWYFIAYGLRPFPSTVICGHLSRRLFLLWTARVLCPVRDGYFPSRCQLFCHREVLPLSGYPAIFRQLRNW